MKRVAEESRRVAEESFRKPEQERDLPKYIVVPAAVGVRIA